MDSMDASMKKAKSKAPHVKPTCWARKFAAQFIVPATHVHKDKRIPLTAPKRSMLRVPTGKAKQKPPDKKKGGTVMRRLRTIACSIIALFCLCQSARAQGTVSAWGFNLHGELGNGTNTTTFPYGIDTPGPVSGLSGVTAIAGGWEHSLALKSDSSVWAWGYNFYGQLGNGTNTNSNTPVQGLAPVGVAVIIAVPVPSSA